MKLILLQCPNCATPLTPENDDVIVQCSHCREAVAIGVDGPSLMKIRFALPAGAKVQAAKMQAANLQANKWVPFWVYSGRVNLHKRETQGGGRSGQKAAEAMWSGLNRFYVPAWDLSLQTAQSIGSQMVNRQPEYQSIERPDEASLVSATVTPSDALHLLEFVILAIEARRDDWLKDLNFELDVGKPVLWALPEDKYW